jgi:hypothetical protein
MAGACAVLISSIGQTSFVIINHARREATIV